MNLLLLSEGCVRPMPPFKTVLFTSFDLFCKPKVSMIFQRWESPSVYLIISFRSCRFLPQWVGSNDIKREKRFGNWVTGSKHLIFRFRVWSSLRACNVGSKGNRFAVQVCDKIDAGLAGQTCHVPPSLWLPSSHHLFNSSKPSSMSGCREHAVDHNESGFCC